MCHWQLSVGYLVPTFMITSLC